MISYNAFFVFRFRQVKRQLFYTISMMVFITMVGLVLNLLALLPAYSAGKFLSADDIKAVALYHNAKSTFLDVKTQKELLSFFNKGEVTNEFNTDSLTKLPMNEIETMVLHRFNHPKVDIYPLGFVENKMVFHVVGLNDAFFILKDGSQELNQLISHAYDS